METLLVLNSYGAQGKRGLVCPNSDPLHKSILKASTNFLFRLSLDLMSSLDLLLPIHYSARYFFDLRINVACTRLDKDPLGYLTC